MEQKLASKFTAIWHLKQLMADKAVSDNIGSYWG